MFDARIGVRKSDDFRFATTCDTQFYPSGPTRSCAIAYYCPAKITAQRSGLLCGRQWTQLYEEFATLKGAHGCAVQRSPVARSLIVITEAVRGKRSGVSGLDARLRRGPAADGEHCEGRKQ